MLILAVGCGSDDDQPLRIYKGAAVQDGVVMGVVLDDETELPVAAEVIVGGTPVRARADGSFEATGVAGRVRVEVRSEGYLKTFRDVAVGGKSLPMPFKIAQKAPKMVPGAVGGSFPFRGAFLEVPVGAYRDGVGVALTYLNRVRIAAIASNPQFIDQAGVPRRAVALVDVDEAPATAVKVRVPVPTDATMDSVAGFVIDGTGQWGTTLAPLFVSGGFAEFALKDDLQIGVAVDVRKADGKRLGYLVTERGDTGNDQGEVLMGNQDLTSIRRPASVIDQRGSRVEVAPGTRARVEVPASTTGVATRTAAYAGQVAVIAGRARVVVPPGVPNDAKLVKMTVKGNAASFEAKGTAFTVTTCSPPTAADLIEVVEGQVSVNGETGTQTLDVGEGETAIACTKCKPGKAPVCLDEIDGGVLGDVGVGPGGSLDSAAADAVASDAPASDGGVTADVPVSMLDTGAQPTPDAGVAPDTRVVDAARVPDTAQPPDAAYDTASISIDTASPAAFRITPSTHMFPNTAVSSSSTVHNFTVTNQGQTASDTPGVSITGNFAITDNGCQGPVLPGATCTIGIWFLPASTGTLTGTLRVVTSDGAATTATLSGVGINPTPPGRFVISPATVDLGWLPVNSTMSRDTFTVTNMGGTATSVPQLTKGGAGANDFIVGASACPNMLAPGQSCTVPVVFFPQSVTGAFSTTQATLTVSGSPGGSATATMTGGALAHTQMEALPASANLGTMKVGDLGQNVTVTLHNRSTNPETLLNALTFTFPQTSELEIKNGCSPNGIALNGSCTIDFSCRPGGLGLRQFNWQANARNGRTGAPAIAGGHVYCVGQ